MASLSLTMKSLRFPVLTPRTSRSHLYSILVSRPSRLIQNNKINRLHLQAVFRSVPNQIRNFFQGTQSRVDCFQSGYEVLLYLRRMSRIMELRSQERRLLYYNTAISGVSNVFLGKFGRGSGGGSTGGKDNKRE